MKKFLTTGLAALVLIAFGCSRGEVENSDAGDGNKAKAYVRLTVSQDPASKTAGGPTDPGLPAESVITNITVVLADEDGVIVSVATPSITGMTTEAFLVPVGTHYVYALVNANDITFTPALAAGVNIHAVQINVADVGDATSGYLDGSFFMTNQHNGRAEQAGFLVNVSAANDINNPAQATIFVDRAAVKIEDVPATSIDVSELVTQPAGSINGVQITGFVLLNVNKQFNVIQQWGIENENGDPLAATADVLHTPVYPTGSLVSTQFFNNIGIYTGITRVGGPGTDITAITDLTITGTDPFVTTPIYTTENRPTIMFNAALTNPLTAGRGETTGVIYRMQAQLNGTSVSTFYVYQGVIYQTIAAIQALPEFVNEPPLPTDAPTLRAMGIRVYENGIMYYTYFIRDPNVAHQYNSNDYYGVFRNSIYRLSVTKISNLGDDVPGGTTVDPNDPGEPQNPPIDRTEAYIEVTVRVNPWILNTIPIEF